MKQIRLGIIGLGRFAEHHISCIREIPFVKVTAVCDLRKQRADDIASQLNCSAYSSWEEMLQMEEFDAADILTPEFAHVEPVNSALRSGCHVFVEKPFALHALEAELMMKTAENVKKLIMVGHVCRFDAKYREVKKAIEEGRLGELRSVYLRRNNQQQYFHIFRRVHPIFTLGIHDIDLMLWLSGSKVTEVFARTSHNPDGDCDMVWTMLKFENGVIGVIENNFLLPDQAPAFNDESLEAVGYSGTIKMQDQNHPLVFWDRPTVDTAPQRSEIGGSGIMENALFAELHHFFTCIVMNEHSAILKPTDAVKAVEIAEAVIQSSKSGLPVYLDGSK